jgi:hypothetical protein
MSPDRSGSLEALPPPERLKRQAESRKKQAAEDSLRRFVE